MTANAARALVVYAQAVATSDAAHTRGLLHQYQTLVHGALCCCVSFGRLGRAVQPAWQLRPSNVRRWGQGCTAPGLIAMRINGQVREEDIYRIRYESATRLRR